MNQDAGIGGVTDASGHKKNDGNNNNNNNNNVVLGGMLSSTTAVNDVPISSSAGAGGGSSGSGSGTYRAPNSKAREPAKAPVETYVYRDFANAEPSALNGEDCHGDGRLPPQSLQSQKLPSKLNAMLSDPDLISIITWMPHGRSWKILNRELFANFALPRYFGHNNHASFVRIVNAWGFRRVSIGVDRDSYYHELFLRSKPRLHQRMKRLPSCHRKTPVDKDDRCPDFYDLAKTSPLPEVNWNNSAAGNVVGGGSSTGNNMPGMPGFQKVGGAAFTPHLNPSGMINNGPFMPEAAKPIHFGDANGAFASNGFMMGGGIGGMAAPNSSFGMAENPMLSLLGMNGMNDQRSAGTTSSSLPQQPPADISSLNAYTQTLQRENENLLLKIKLLEYENQAKQQQQQQPTTASNNQQPNNNLNGPNGIAGEGLSLGVNNNMNMGGCVTHSNLSSNNPTSHDPSNTSSL